MAETEERQEWEKITLLTVADGALPELFAREHLAVLENIADPNTHAAAKRHITIKLTYIPGSTGESATIISDVVSKFAPVKQVGQTVYLSPGSNGERAAYRHNVKQTSIPGMLSPAPAGAGVVSINRVTQG